MVPSSWHTMKMTGENSTWIGTRCRECNMCPGKGLNSKRGEALPRFLKPMLICGFKCLACNFPTAWHNGSWSGFSEWRFAMLGSWEAGRLGSWEARGVAGCWGLDAGSWLLDAGLRSFGATQGKRVAGEREARCSERTNAEHRTSNIEHPTHLGRSFIDKARA